MPLEGAAHELGEPLVQPHRRLVLQRLRLGEAEAADLELERTVASSGKWARMKGRKRTRLRW